MTNPIQYSSRTYNTIIADINADSELKDKPNWWKRLWAGVGDVLSMIINATANDMYLETAFTDESIDKLLAMIDYERTVRTTSSGYVLFYINRSATFPFTVALTDLVAYTESSAVVSSMRFEAVAAVTFTAFSETFTVNAGTDLLTIARTGGYYTGDLVRLSTTGTLPTATGGGLSVSTDYYAIRIATGTIKLARTLANAYNGTAIDITSTGSGTHTITLYSKPVTMYQQQTTSDVVVGTSDGSTSWQEFPLPDLNILRSSVVVTINAVVWTRVDTFVDSILTDKHYKVKYSTDGTCKIVFGNGTYGEIPGAFDVIVDYAVGGGADSNVTVSNRINSYGGTDSNISGVSNSGTLTGGSERESNESAKVVAPMLLKSRSRFITVDDGEYLVLNYGGVSRVKITRNFYGPLSCKVVIVPNGGGAPSSALKTALDTYLTDRSVLGSIDIRFVDPSYVATAFTADVHPSNGYVFSDIQPMFELAVRFCLSALTYELQQYYYTNGIADTVTYINTLWSTSFISTDYNEIQRLLLAATSPNLETNVNQSDVYALLDSVTGVDWFTVTVPAAWPVAITTNQICDVGAITTAGV